jgi:P pilus assembly chaperone PapD
MTLRNCVRPTFLLLAAAVGVISLAIAVYVAHPKIEISPQSAILENGRREAPFRVKNDGVFALFDVGVLQWWPKGATGEIEPAASIR